MRLNPQRWLLLAGAVHITLTLAIFLVGHFQLLPNLVRMRLDEQRLEDSLIRFDLALQLEVDFRSHARLPLVGHDVEEIARVAIGAQNRAAEAALLPLDGRSDGARVHRVTRNAAIFAVGSFSSRDSTIALTSASISPSTWRMRVKTVPRLRHTRSCARFSSTSICSASLVRSEASASLRSNAGDVMKRKSLFSLSVRSASLSFATCMATSALRSTSTIARRRAGATTITPLSTKSSFLPEGNAVVARIP